jgi:adenine deaminase
MYQVSGNIVDIHNQEIYPGVVIIENNRIADIKRENKVFDGYIIPGLVDSHVHIESSMLVPVEFSRMAIKHGTVATVSDPHEIANVVGVKGVEFMIENGKNAKLKFHWGVPSCVPATDFETSGARLDADDIQYLLTQSNVVCLAEMMNFPGVINSTPEILSKINLAVEAGLPVDGHAPGLGGENLMKYIDSGISTDHECTTLDEAIEKVRRGMKILIREGSSAKNFDELAPLVDMFPESIMLCSDDIHPDDLVKGHINRLLKRGIKVGLNLFNLLRAATLNPVLHYNLKVGLLKPGDYADFCIVENLTDFKVRETWVNGEKVFGPSVDETVEPINTTPINNFVAYRVESHQIRVPNTRKNFKAIGVIDGELLTKCVTVQNNHNGEFIEPDLESDILKIIVVNRYRKTQPSVGFVKNFGLKMGAIASSVAHDSHNIIAVGTNDDDILHAIHLLMESKGGIAASYNGEYLLLPLPVAGIMSVESAGKVAEAYLAIDQRAKEYGCKLKAPFMTLSFLALLVIPELKIGDKGLFDVNTFSFINLFE